MAESREAQQHIAAAMALAKPDLVREAEASCTALGPQRPAVLAQNAARTQDPVKPVEPIRVFDNLYYFGFNTIGAWAISTSDGIILIDALNSPKEAEEILIPGMRKVGLDPAQIKYVIVGHGHFDHFGGVPYLQEWYNAPVLMAGADWELISRPPPANSSAERRARPVPTRRVGDKDVLDGQQVTLGDTTVTLALTPGHTPGTLAILIPVKHRGTPHMALMLSGVLQTPTRQSLVALEHVLSDFARAKKAATVINGHPGIFVGQTVEVMQSIGKNPSGAHPLLYGVERFDRYLSIMIECSRARIAAMEG